ncbi:carcinoembryonic antigen-related cell adhesion molecule 21-like [Talpa occidentalis]|uniref:carcinoembryonic antigen-related cell adhesion molecule 21-like n=1 Tax=Talpa occidentalis TaxID=50954 RepID=UPI00188E2840|nr:carcinoembryonic antigen-related cell adhesion molecule 21-like [Talpa occidentalis]
MEAPSAHGHRGRVPWTGLQLAVSLLIFWIPPRSGGFTVESRQNNVTSNFCTIISATYMPPGTDVLIWYKGNITNGENRIASYFKNHGSVIPGPACNSRQTINTDGSLVIHRPTRKDSGYYTLEAVRGVQSLGSVSIQVFLLDPETPFSVQESPSTVQENDIVFIVCQTNGKRFSVNWYVNEQKLQKKHNMYLSSNQYTLTINPIRRQDSGIYRCMYHRGMRFGRSESLTLLVVQSDRSPHK